MALPKLMEPPNGFVFEEPPGRPFRTISMETEVDGDQYALAQSMYGAGVIGTDRRMDYGWHPGKSHPHLAFLKYDGSVTGGELVFDKVDLTNPDHAKMFLCAHLKLRDLEKAGDIAYNPNCGGHVHIDGNGYGYYDILRLLVLFGFMEEPIFRLAGAGKTYGHRTLWKGYDQANGGRGYSDPVVKGPFVDPGRAVAAITGQKRMSGVNTSIYFNSGCIGSHASCKPKVIGAGMYDLKECNCIAHVKRTIEWRVWNAQGNPRIVHAWIALMQAFHAYAWRPVGLDYTKHEDMPEFTWTWKPYDVLTREQKIKAQERVEFMFTELPLTSDEKRSLRYAFNRTPYKTWGKEWFARMVDTPYKPPPFPNKYARVFKRSIVLEGPDVKNPTKQAKAESPDVVEALRQFQARQRQEAQRRRRLNINFQAPPIMIQEQPVWDPIEPVDMNEPGR